jgi:hypothetical protein
VKVAIRRTCSSRRPVRTKPPRAHSRSATRSPMGSSAFTPSRLSGSASAPGVDGPRVGRAAGVPLIEVTHPPVGLAWTSSAAIRNVAAACGATGRSRDPPPQWRPPAPRRWRPARRRSWRHPTDPCQWRRDRARPRHRRSEPTVVSGRDAPIPAVARTAAHSTRRGAYRATRGYPPAEHPAIPHKATTGIEPV